MAPTIIQTARSYVTHYQVREGRGNGSSRIPRDGGPSPRSDRGSHQGQSDRHQSRRVAHDEETADAADGHLLSIPWQTPPSRKSRQILIPDGIPKSEIRPTRIERRARLVSAIARGRRWLDEIVSGSVTDVQQIASRQKCSVRQVNMTISLAFLAPYLVRAGVEGRLPRGIGVEQLREAPAEWSRHVDALGVNR